MWNADIDSILFIGQKRVFVSAAYIVIIKDKFQENFRMHFKCW